LQSPISACSTSFTSPPTSTISSDTGVPSNATLDSQLPPPTPHLSATPTSSHPVPSTVHLDTYSLGELVADLFYRVGYFLEETAKYEGAETVYIKARYYYQLASQSLDVAKMDYSIARVLIAQVLDRDLCTALTEIRLDIEKQKIF
jgi:hypothetical protein